MNNVLNGSQTSAAVLNGNLVDYELLRRLQAENKALRTENARLAKELRFAQTPGRIATLAASDAMLLVGDYVAGLDISRESMTTRHGMSRRRWEWARALLRLARCTDGLYRLQTLDAVAIQHRIEIEVGRIIDEGDAGLRRLKARLPNGRQRELS